MDALVEHCYNINGVKIEDTYAEAFKMWAARLLITAASPEWAEIAARSLTGFATSVIGCGCEAGIERLLDPSETPDARPGVSVLLFTTFKKTIGQMLLLRIGQCVLTCPTTACFNGLAGQDVVTVGRGLRFFGDGFQISKRLEGRRLWRIPVTEGEFLVDENFGVAPAVGGGNFMILGETAEATLAAAESAAEAARRVPGVILPFPGGIVRSASKVGSRYRFLKASSNTYFCPTLRAQVDSAVPAGVSSVLEIVIDGLDEDAVRSSMRAGIEAACQPGVVRISAGNYGGRLGQYPIHLKELWP